MVIDDVYNFNCVLDKMYEILKISEYLLVKHNNRILCVERFQHILVKTPVITSENKDC